MPCVCIWCFSRAPACVWQWFSDVSYKKLTRDLKHQNTLGAMACLFKSAAASFMRSSSKGTCLYGPSSQEKACSEKCRTMVWTETCSAWAWNQLWFGIWNGTCQSLITLFNLLPAPTLSQPHFLDKLPDQFFVVMLKVRRILVGQCFGRQNETTNRYKLHLSIPSPYSDHSGYKQTVKQSSSSKSSHTMATWVITQWSVWSNSNIFPQCSNRSSRPI